VLFESFVDICRYLARDQIKGRYLQFGNGLVARPYNWGAPWKGTYAVSHEAYKRSGGWNGHVYDTYDNGAGDQFQYNFMRENGFQNFLTLPRPIVAQEFIPRVEALQAGCESKWQNITSITASNLLHQILNILNPYPVTGSSHDFYHIDFFRRPEAIIDDLFKGIQYKRKNFNMFEQALVKDFIDPQGRPIYPETRLDFGDSVVRSKMLDRLYALEALGRRLAQSNNIKRYPNLLKIFQFIGLPANDVISKTSPESTNMVYISGDKS
jgi:hypothetical protein